MVLSITSPSFKHQGDIPRKFTCEGSDISPELEWSGAPPATKSFALIVDDPDAPDPSAPKTIWVHWVLYNMPATASGLPEGVAQKALPTGTLEGENDWKRTGYGGPCPPIGRHRYFFRLYALDAVLPKLETADKKAVKSAIEGHVVGEAELMGTYQKTGKERGAGR